MKLYYLPGTAAMAPHMVLEEAGADYELVLVERDNGQVVDPPNYRELNPHDLVPTLVDGDLILHEAAAVVMYLSDAYPGAALAPMPGTAARGHWYRWLIYLTNTVQPAQLNRLYPERYTTGAHGGEGVRRAGEASLERMRGWIDGELGRSGPVPARRHLHERRSLPLHAHALEPDAGAEVVGLAEPRLPLPANRGATGGRSRLRAAGPRGLSGASGTARQPHRPAAAGRAPAQER